MGSYLCQEGCCKVRDFVKMLRNVTPLMGIDVKEPQFIEIINDRSESYCNAIREIINPTLQIIVAIFLHQEMIVIVLLRNCVVLRCQFHPSYQCEDNM
ncbi:piwi-like protein [Trichonephila clavata]|uniref:Piwi-like protein n=1 Tax=Trichonephila clavata TaxID=2740835 RepID=A0A8X6FR02_TRICU|nr:piwi-like protein [Trichonephila clavata]